MRGSATGFTPLLLSLLPPLLRPEKWLVEVQGCFFCSPPFFFFPPSLHATTAGEAAFDHLKAGSFSFPSFFLFFSPFSASFSWTPAVDRGQAIVKLRRFFSSFSFSLLFFFFFFFLFYERCWKTSGSPLSFPLSPFFLFFA